MRFARQKTCACACHLSLCKCHFWRLFLHYFFVAFASKRAGSNITTKKGILVHNRSWNRIAIRCTEKEGVRQIYEQERWPLFCPSYCGHEATTKLGFSEIHVGNTTDSEGETKSKIMASGSAKEGIFSTPPLVWNTNWEHNCANWKIDFRDLCCIMIYVILIFSEFRFLGVSFLACVKNRHPKIKNWPKTKTKILTNNKTRSKQTKKNTHKTLQFQEPKTKNTTKQ